MKIAVLGMGYLGTTHAACMASLGHEVLGVDIDDAKLAKLQAGEIPFYEPGLDKLTEKVVSAGRLHFTSSFAEAAEFADAHFIAVGTPQKKGEFAADVSAIDSVIDTLAPLLTRNVVIFGKSTVPVGTAERLRLRLQDLAPAGTGVELAWNPEFLREGHAIEDTLKPDRVVLGTANGSDGRAIEVAREIYSSILEDSDIPFITTDLPTAELVKTSANAFLATKISFINAISEVCEAAGADVVELADAIGYDHRIGRAFLNAGLGFGGGCLPKDIRAFMARAGELGADQALTFLREVDTINMRRRRRMVELTREVCGSLLGVRVAVLGAAFKPDSDDVRDSPALNVAGQLQLQGAAVNVYDPKAMDNSRRLFPTLGYATSAKAACEGADVVLVLTEWREFQDLDPVALSTFVKHRRVLDGRNCLDPQAWRDAGWQYRGLGRRRPS
jgi:UDPglucose 6-dehydrogenase